MSDGRPPRAFPQAVSALTPEAIAETVRILVPEGIVAVQGFAENISEPRAYGGGRPIVFGELVLGSALLAFRVPAENAPRNGEAVIVEGRLSGRLVTRSTGTAWRGDWKVTLIGQVVGNWTPRAARAPTPALPTRGARIPLGDFIGEHGIGSLTVLSSRVGHRDLAQSLASAGRAERPVFVEANFGDAGALLRTILELPTGGNMRGIALARGGGQGLDVIGGSREIVAALIGKRVPFYTALGHDTDVVLADRSADQVFHTPSELGAALARAAGKADAAAERDRRLSAQSGMIDRQKAELDRQAATLAGLRDDAVRAGEAARTRVAGLRRLLIGAGIVLALMAWLLVGRF